MELDILAFAAHPDDVELACSGTLIKHIALGHKVGIVDLTKGELGTRGTAELRMKESAKSSEVMGLSYRYNLGLPDGFLNNDPQYIAQIVKQIRLLKPKIVLGNAINDRHPDHGAASKMVDQAIFLCGLPKYEVAFNNEILAPWRPSLHLNYIQDYYIEPDIVVDVTLQVPTKMNAIRCFDSQFYKATSLEIDTPISRPDFLDFVEARMREMGRKIHVTFAEGFTMPRTPGIENLFKLI